MEQILTLVIAIALFAFGFLLVVVTYGSLDIVSKLDPTEIRKWTKKMKRFLTLVAITLFMLGFVLIAVSYG
jgi:hypothetical protein